MSEDYPDTLFQYFAAIDSYENLEGLFHKNPVNPTSVIQELYNCGNKIDTLIAGKTSDYEYLVEIFQLKRQALQLIKFIEQKFRNQISMQSINGVNEANANQPNKDANLEQLLYSALETPRIQGLKDIAGLWDIKKTLKSLIVLPRSQPQLFSNRKPCNSILLFGPPGTGKTHLVHALTYDAGATLYSISASNIISSFLGQSEKNLQYLFHHITNSEIYTILFIDEIDGFCKKRNNSEQEHSRRLKTELMCQLSKVETASNMCLICATNCPWDLDTAFLRRFHQRIYIPLPGSGDRLDLLQLFIKNTPLENDEGIKSCWEYLIDKTDGFSGSDISNLVQDALNAPIVELEDTKIWKSIPQGCYRPVTKTDDLNSEGIICDDLSNLPPCSVRARSAGAADLLNSLDSFKVTITKQEVVKYEEYISY